MKTLEMVQATAPLAEYAQKIKREPVIVTADGQPIAALVSLENMDWETIALSLNTDFMALIEQSRLRQRTEGGISGQEMRQRLGVG